MKIARSDAHIHLFARGYPGKYGSLFPRGGELATYENIRQIHGIKRALVIGFEGEAWARGNNRYIANLAAKHSWIVPLAFCATTLRPTERKLKAWWDMGFRGLSLYLSRAEDLSWLASWPAEVYAALNKKKAIISINADLPLLSELGGLLAGLPETRILISHLGSPGPIGGDSRKDSLEQILRPVLTLAGLSHFGVKLSGFYACSEFPHDGIVSALDLFRENFGEQRLFWGSDFCPALDEVTFAQTIQPVERWRKSASIFHRNLDRIMARVA